MAAAPEKAQQTPSPLLVSHCELCSEIHKNQNCRCVHKIGIQLNTRRNLIMDPKRARKVINQLFETPQRQFKQLLDDTTSSIRSLYSTGRSWWGPPGRSSRSLSSYSSSSSLDRDTDFMYAMRCSPRKIIVPPPTCANSLLPTRNEKNKSSFVSRIVSTLRSFACGWKGHRPLSEFDSTNSDVSDSDLVSRTSWVPALRMGPGHLGEGPLETWHPVLGSSSKDPWTIRLTRHWEPTLPAIRESEMEGACRLPVSAHTMVVGWLQPRYYSAPDAPFKKVPFHNNLHLLRFQ